MDETQVKRLERGVIVLPEEIDHAAYELLLDALDQAQGREIRLFCRGNGGSSEDALAIVDLIQAHGQVVGLLPSLAASSHGIIWASCARRYVYPNGRLGVHMVAWNSISTRVDSVTLERMRVGYTQLDTVNARILAAASNKTVRQWSAALKKAGRADCLYFDAVQLFMLKMARPVTDLARLPAKPVASDERLAERVLTLLAEV